jgi:hypothetical protein
LYILEYVLATPRPETGRATPQPREIQGSGKAKAGCFAEMMLPGPFG